MPGLPRLVIVLCCCSTPFSFCILLELFLSHFLKIFIFYNISFLFLWPSPSPPHQVLQLMTGDNSEHQGHTYHGNNVVHNAKHNAHSGMDQYHLNKENEMIPDIPSSDNMMKGPREEDPGTAGELSPPTLTPPSVECGQEVSRASVITGRGTLGMSL